MPVGAREGLLRYADEWEAKGVVAWEEGWWELPVTVGDQVADLLRFLKNFAREMQRQIVGAQHAEQIDALFVGRAENLDDFAFGIGVSGLPFAQFDHDLVAGAGGGLWVAGHRCRAAAVDRRE